MKNTTIALAAALSLACAAPALADKPAHVPDQSMREVGAMLEARGYHHIQVEPESSRPGHVAYGCKGRSHFRIYVDEGNNITDVEPTGDCDPRGGPSRVHVQAPFTDVRVGEGGVHVKAPFVDIRIPR
ncbi:MAG: hypothetical protein VX871_04005 [Pseudomonadota bacterium]|nr:hypothetical protein [Pseudomonadota bacterium]